MQVLAELAAHPGDVYKKEDLIHAVWPDTFVEEKTLTQNIFTLRKVLGPDETGRHYIETVPKHGYRFVAEVRESREGEESPAPAPAFARAAGERRAPKFGLVGSGVNAAGGGAAARPRLACTTRCPPKPFAFAAAFALVGVLAFATYYALNGVPGATAGQHEHAAQSCRAR